MREKLVVSAAPAVSLRGDVYRKAGRYAITLVATDPVGHAVTVARTSVRISPRRS